MNIISKFISYRDVMGIFISLFLGLMIPGCVPHGSSVPGSSNIVDLTHPFDENTIYWPTSKSFHLDVVHKGTTKNGFWYEANNFESAEHGGTHMDAPAHFARGGWTVEQIPLANLIAPGVLVDISNKAGANPDYQFTARDFLDWEKINGTIESGTIVLVRSGFEKYWPDKKRYLGTDKEGDTANLHFPGFSEEAAKFLTRERKVAAIGLDTPSLDHGPSKQFLAHQVFGEANVPGFENLHGLDQLPPRGFRVIALPMKIGGGSGSPLRIVAEIF